jgi:hypothetical protein
LDPLKTATVDLSLLVVTARALAVGAARESRDQRRERKRWVREIRHAVVAYLEVLWRNEDARFDAAALARCRHAAQAEMPTAVLGQPRIAQRLRVQDRALDGYASVRNDLWRLAHLVVKLRGVRRVLMRQSQSRLVAPRTSPGKRLQRSLRRAMSAYTRKALRSTSAHEAVAGARRDASAFLDERCLRWAEALAEIAQVRSATELGVVRPLQALAKDWARV